LSTFSAFSGISQEQIKRSNIQVEKDSKLNDIWVTCIAVAYLETTFPEFLVHWDLIGKKAKKWLSSQYANFKLNSSEWEKLAGMFVKANSQLNSK
jgi:hypothetical protein